MTTEPEALARQLGSSERFRTLPPLEEWHPELSGDMDLVIRRDGTWLYQGKPIAREETVRLFARILRREDDGEFYLVTPVEKWRIQVEDAPLLAYALNVNEVDGEQVLRVTTNMGETLEIGDEHPLSVGEYPETGEPRPVIGVRHGVEARLTTQTFYELADLAIERKEADGRIVYGVMSRGRFWPIGQED